MTREEPLVVIDLSFAVTACDCGVFPDVEYLCWLRSVKGMSKALVVQAAETVPVWERKSYPPGTERVYITREYPVPMSKMEKLVALLREFGLHERKPDVVDHWNVDLTWWVKAMLRLSVNGESERSMIVDISRPITGEDAPCYIELVRELIQMGDVAETPWWERLLPAIRENDAERPR